MSRGKSTDTDYDDSTDSPTDPTDMWFGGTHRAHTHGANVPNLHKHWPLFPVESHPLRVLIIIGVGRTPTARLVHCAGGFERTQGDRQITPSGSVSNKQIIQYIPGSRVVGIQQGIGVDRGL